MAPKLAFFTLFLVLFISFVSANFVCGEVHSSEDVSSTWMSVLLYYDERPSDILTCSVTGEGRYCCDLEEIETVSWNVGKVVWAEVYDVQSGYVSDRVSLVTTEESYDLFPSVTIAKPLIFDNFSQMVFVNQSSLLLSGTLHPYYNNLRVTVFNDSFYESFDVCMNCTSFAFPLNLTRGILNVTFEAYGERSFIESYLLYNLDFLHVNRSFSCDECRIDDDLFRIPSRSLVNVSLFISASHSLTGEVLEHIPHDWFFVSDMHLIPFTESHNAHSFFMNGSFFETSYVLQSPRSLLPRKYTFLSSVGGFLSSQNVSIRPFFWRWISYYFSQEFSEHPPYSYEEVQYVSPHRPLLLVLPESELYVVSISASTEGFYYGSVIEDDSLFSSKITYEIQSNLDASVIESIYVQFRVPKDEMVQLFQHETEIPLSYVTEDETFLYYGAYITTKDKFYTISV